MSVFTNPASGSLENAKAYIAAVIDLVGDQDPIQVLARTPGAIRDAIEGLSDDQLRALEAPGKWSIAQVVQHLADSEVVWGWRLRLTLAHDRPAITGYDQDLWADRLRYADADLELALRAWSALRQMHLRLLTRLGPADLERVGIHAERGEESVRHMIRLYAGHDLLHLRQVERIRGAVAGGDS